MVNFFICQNLQEDQSPPIDKSKDHFAYTKIISPWIAGDYVLPDCLDCLCVSLHPPHLGFSQCLMPDFTMPDLERGPHVRAQ